MPLLRPLALPILLLTLALPAGAAVRLTTTMNGSSVEVEWNASSFPIRYQADQRLLTALPGGAAMLERAFAAWSSVDRTRLAFQPMTVGSSLTAGHDGVNSVTLSDDLFANQRAIAVTTNWDVQGKLTESDIQVDATLIGSSYNIEQALVHEVGHLLGLDHSPVLSAIMYPYVSRGNDPVALDSDDRVAITAIYPQIDRTMLGGTLRGRVTGDSGGIFAAQVVAVNEAGVPVATGLTNRTGDFTLEGVPEGTYRLYAEPLDGPVDTRNLSSFWQQGNSSSFRTEFHAGAPLEVISGRVVGNLMVNASGTSDLNPRWVGVSAAGSRDFRLTTTALTVQPGQTVSVAVAGDGITPGVATFELLSPGLRRVSEFGYAGNYVFADFQIPADAPGGSAVILVKRGNESAALTGALKVADSKSGGRGRIAGRR